MYHKWPRSFNAVAKEGSFVVAGRSLNIGQPTVTTQIKALNERFKVELFHRKGHQIWLSDTGQGLYDVTQGIFAQEEEAIELLRGSSEFESGVLRRVGGCSGGRDPGSWNRTRRGIRIHSRQTTSHRAGVECRYEKLSLRLLLKEKNTAPEDQCVSGPGRRGKFEKEGRLEGKGAGLKLNNVFVGFWKRGR